MDGLTPLEVSGRVSSADRRENLLKFKDPKRNERLLVLSSVGNVGLNLHEARFLIFADSIWSGQAEEQIIGRIHRQPNKQKCIIYFPRVKGTSDTILAEFADVKERLLARFVGKKCSL